VRTAKSGKEAFTILAQLIAKQPIRISPIGWDIAHNSNACVTLTLGLCAGQLRDLRA
jgi:hypothetical protein